MAGRGSDEDDWVARLHRSGAVVEQDAVERPTIERLNGEVFHTFQRERRVVLEFELLDLAVGANLAEKRDDGPRFGMSGRKSRHRAAGRQIAVQYPHVLHGQPPLTGGRRAISSPSFAANARLSGRTAPLSAS